MKNIDKFFNSYKPRYYDKEGREIGHEEWARKFSESTYKILKQDNINGYFISTVWLGQDHDFFGHNGKPLIFETMAFKAEKDKDQAWDEKFMERYSTMDEALLGHQGACKAAESGQLDRDNYP